MKVADAIRTRARTTAETISVNEDWESSLQDEHDPLWQTLDGFEPDTDQEDAEMRSNSPDSDSDLGLKRIMAEAEPEMNDDDQAGVEKYEMDLEERRQYDLAMARSLEDMSRQGEHQGHATTPGASGSNTSGKSISIY